MWFLLCRQVKKPWSGLRGCESLQLLPSLKSSWNMVKNAPIIHQISWRFMKMTDMKMTQISHGDSKWPNVHEPPASIATTTLIISDSATHRNLVPASMINASFLPIYLTHKIVLFPTFRDPKVAILPYITRRSTVWRPFRLSAHNHLWVKSITSVISMCHVTHVTHAISIEMLKHEPMWLTKIFRHWISPEQGDKITIIFTPKEKY